MFKKASKKKSKLRLAIEGASGSGKTYSALVLAKGLGKKMAVIDTEFGSASLYADKFDFDVLNLDPPYSPERYIEAIKNAEEAGYDVCIIDSMSHEWNGEGGCLDIQNKMGGNSYTSWGKVTPRHDKFINAILTSRMHIISTLRSKANYETGKDTSGKMTVEKKGTSPIQRDSVDYEFTIVFDLNQQHMARASKDRTSLFDGQDFIIDNNISKKLIDWLESGEEVKQSTVKTPPAKTAPVSNAKPLEELPEQADKVKTTEIIEVTVKNGTNKKGEPYELFTVTAKDMTKYKTFIKDYAEMCKKAKETAEPVTISYKVGQWGNDIVNVDNIPF
jgi:hypothetical protein